MNINEYAVRVAPGQDLLDIHPSGQFSPLTAYLNEAEDYQAGTVLLVPTYRLEEVEEIIEPEKPGVPVEPYVGLSWTCSLGYRRFVASVQGNKYEVIAEVDKGSVWSTVMPFLGEYNWDNYPRTPSTPAVSRKVKKWVKIDHPEVPE
jgi:hypothetical protein